MPDTPRDQPSGVTTQEPERPADEHVVTSDTAHLTAADTAPPKKDQPAPAADSKPADSNDQNPAPDTQQTQTSAKPRNRRVERTIRRLNRKLSDAERRDAEKDERIARLEQTVAGLTNQSEPAPEPKFEDFASPKEYAKAYTQWEKSSAESESPPAPDKQPPARSPQRDPEPASHPVVDSEIQAFQQRGIQKFGDEFKDALVDNDVATNQQMAEFMMDSDHGPDIYLHLANNPEESVKIFDSGPARAQRALDALQAKAEKGELDIADDYAPADPPPAQDKGQVTPPRQQQQQQRQSTQRVTKAPQPPSETRDGGNVDLGIDPERESMDDYAARRRKEEAQRMGYTIT